VPRPLVALEAVGCRPGNEGSLERVTTIAMGTEIDGIVESEDLAASHENSPTAVALLD
jgi:glyoxylate carboligase